MANKVILLVIVLLAAILRFAKLDAVPMSLYWDEASLGYNAYSILETGKDEFGKSFPATNFAAFGDYKPPLYIYAAVPSIALFGLNEFAIRFPSAFFGTLTVLLTYFLARSIFQTAHPQGEAQFKILNFKFEIPALAALMLAISPWHIQLSRGAFEANLGLFFSVLGILLFIKFATEKSLTNSEIVIARSESSSDAAILIGKDSHARSSTSLGMTVGAKLVSLFLPLSLLSFLAAMYTFTGQRLFVPFILVILAIQFRKQVLAHLKLALVSLAVAGFLFWPLFIFATQTLEGRLRFEEVNIFRDLEPADRSTRYRDLDDFAWWSQIIHNRRFEYSLEYLIHYFDAFNPSFLFTKGDANPRLAVGEVGQLYLVDLPLILAGIYFLFAKKQPYRFLIIGWLLVSPLGPATARETPHALRMIHILPAFQLIAAYGLFQLVKLVKFKKLLIAGVTLLMAANLFYYLEVYYQHWAKNYADQWQYGYKQAVEVVKSRYENVDHVVVTKSMGRPYIYFLIYMQYDPRLYWQSQKVVRDQFYFLDVDGFGKFLFGDPSQFKGTGKILYVVPPGQLPLGTAKITTIERPDKTAVLDIGETQ